MPRKQEKLTKLCPHCDGNGWMEVTGIYADTWRLLKQHGPISGAALSELAECQATAMNNRLAALEVMQLAESQRYGRLRLFRAVNR